MKRSGLSLAFASATLFHIPLAAAQDMAAGMAPPSMSGTAMGERPGSEANRAAALLKRFDLNGDGRIDDVERAEAREMMLQEQVDRQMARVTASQATPDVFRQRALEFFDANRAPR
jgi:hypothetical protein